MNARRKLIRGAYLRLMINNTLILIATCACGFIDNLFIGQRLGKEALAAVGFFSPVSTAVGFSYILIMGTQILTGNLIGAGNTKAVNRLFATVCAVMAAFFAVFSVVCVAFAGPIAKLLGAKGSAFTQLCEYIRGYAPGIVPQTLAALFMALCSFNNDLKRSYCSTAAMILGNLIGDWLLVGPYGLFGIGIASTISSLAAFLVLLPGFFNKDKLFRFRAKDGMDFRLAVQAAVRGLPSLMFTIGIIIKNYSFNYALNHYTGSAGVAVAGIMSTVCAVAGAFPGGCAGAFSTLAGIYYGEEDRDSYLDLAGIAIRTGIAACTAMTALIMLLSATMSAMFVPQRNETFVLAQRMFVLGFTFLVPNVVYCILIQSRRAQNRMLLVNIMSFAETTMIGVFVLLTVQHFGTDAAWLANTVVDLVCILILLVSVIRSRGKFDLSLPALLMLKDSFGAEAHEYMTAAAANMEDVTELSGQAVEFCIRNAYPGRTAFHVGLCVEEMAGNVLEHGFRGNRNCSADVRIVSKGGKLTVRIRDNCREFDPRRRIDIYDPDHPENNVGIRLTSKIAKQIDYYNNAGINTLIMKL